jgi:hypothetical protein
VHDAPTSTTLYANGRLPRAPDAGRRRQRKAHGILAATTCSLLRQEADGRGSLLGKRV